MAERTCVECGEPITGGRSDRILCSKTCRNRRSKRQRNRAGLLADRRRYYEAHPDQYTYAVRRTSVLKHDLKRRAQRRGASIAGASFSVDDVAQRDRWTCRLCGEPVDRAIPWPHVMSKSIDHTVPVSRGGTHSLDNVQLAHLGCNCAKGNRHSA